MDFQKLCVTYAPALVRRTLAFFPDQTSENVHLSKMSRVNLEAPKLGEWDTINLFITARRDLSRLWKAKNKLWESIRGRFPKSDPILKALSQFCHGDPTCKIRVLADNSACRYADRYGDDMFRQVVDGIPILSVTQWFYGLSLLSVAGANGNDFEDVSRFSANDVEMLEEVALLAHVFFESVSNLPTIPLKDLRREAHKFQNTFAKAQSHVSKYSPLYAAFLCIVKRLPSAIASNVIAFCD